MIKLKTGLTLLLTLLFAAGLLGPLASAALAQSRAPGGGKDLKEGASVKDAKDKDSRDAREVAPGSGVTGVSAHTAAQPTSLDLRAQRRLELRSELLRQRSVTEDELSTRPTLQTVTAAPADRHLSAQEREEMRQQLREQRLQQEQQDQREQRQARVK